MVIFNSYVSLPEGTSLWEWRLQFANWKMAIEIVSFPMKQMVIFYSYVNVYQRVT